MCYFHVDDDVRPKFFWHWNLRWVIEKKIGTLTKLNSNWQNENLGEGVLSFKNCCPIPLFSNNNIFSNQINKNYFVTNTFGFFKFSVHANFLLNFKVFLTKGWMILTNRSDNAIVFFSQVMHSLRCAVHFRISTDETRWWCLQAKPH